MATSSHRARAPGPRRRAATFTASALAVASLSIGACGSRTGLFGADGAGVTVNVDASVSLDASLDGPTPCIPGRFSFEVARPQVMFVIDRSGSMSFTLDGQETVPPGEQSRWDLLHDALEETVLPLDRQLATGAKFFPEVAPDGSLDVPEISCRTDDALGLAPDIGNMRTVLNVFRATRPRGGTPTAEAIRIAAEQLAARRGVARYIVVATDGAPNCNGDLNGRNCVCTTPRSTCSANDRGRFSCLDDVRAIDAVRESADVRKIPVFVIGLGSTERPEFLRVLDDMAVAGGRPRANAPRHYNVQRASELSSALVAIRDSISKCTFLTPSSPEDPDAIAVEIDGAIVKRDPTRRDGWDWVDQAYGELAFFGDACERAQRGTAKVGGVVSCTADR
jgi:hypothetical protein